MFVASALPSKELAWTVLRNLDQTVNPDALTGLSVYQTKDGSFMVGCEIEEPATEETLNEVMPWLRWGELVRMTAEEYTAYALQSRWALIGDAGNGIHWFPSV